MMPGRPVVVFGKSGQLATCIRRTIGDDGAYFGREEVDVLSLEDVRRVLSERKPAFAINAAGYTAVDRAETERAEALALNATGPAIVAKACAQLEVPLVHVSTDYVFSGESGAPYLEDAPTSPVNFYGETKLQGEVAVITAHPKSAIVRTSWLHSDIGANFVRTMHRLSQEKDEIGVVCDQIGRPTSAYCLAEACLALGAALVEGAEDVAGVYHFANSGEAAWSDVASAVMQEAAARGLRTARIRPIPTSEYPTAAKRPRDSRLSTGRIEALTGRRPKPWRDALGEVCARLFAA